MNEEEKKAIANFKYWIDTNTEKGVCYLPDYIYAKVLNLIEKLQKENEELRKKLNEENKRCMMLAIEKQDYFEKYRYNLQQNESLTKEFSNVIPIQKIKDKIEELDKAYEDSKDENGESEYYYPDYTIRVLEELLGDK